MKKSFFDQLPKLCGLTLMRSKFKVLVHLFLSCRICDKKDSLLSNITPRNLASSTTGIDDPLRSKHGSGCYFRSLQK